MAHKKSMKFKFWCLKVKFYWKRAKPFAQPKTVTLWLFAEKAGQSPAFDFHGKEVPNKSFHFSLLGLYPVSLPCYSSWEKTINLSFLHFHICTMGLMALTSKYCSKDVN